MREEKELNGKTYTIENGIVKIAGKEITVYRYGIMHPSKAPKPIYEKVRETLPGDYVYVSSAGCFMPREIAEIAADQMDQVVAAEKAKKEKNIPGLEILQDAIYAIDEYHKAFDRMMEDGNNDGVRPPSIPDVDLGALHKQYPIATAYLTAKAWSMAAHDVKSGAGSRAMKKIENGENAEEAIATMRAEWSKHTEEHMWD